MNEENQENGPRGPVIFTVPAYSLIVAVSRDWCFSSQKKEHNPIPETYSPCACSRSLAISREILDP
jgi:hypothetical protein